MTEQKLINAFNQIIERTSQKRNGWCDRLELDLENFLNRSKEFGAPCAYDLDSASNAYRKAYRKAHFLYFQLRAAKEAAYSQALESITEPSS